MPTSGAPSGPSCGKVRDVDLVVDPGTLLAAWPDLRDPNFMHTVLLMCQHSEEGAYGLVVNRPTELVVKQLMPDHPLLGQSEFPVFLGGPVDHQTLQFVHVEPERVPGGLPLGEGIHLGGELDALAALLVEDPDRARDTVRLLLGYSGWAAGQLDQELAVGSWVPAPGSRGAVFGTEPDATWRDVVRSVDPNLGTLPPDAQWN